MEFCQLAAVGTLLVVLTFMKSPDVACGLKPTSTFIYLSVWSSDDPSWSRLLLASAGCATVCEALVLLFTFCGLRMGFPDGLRNW